MLTLGYILAIAMGLTLGLIGAGGSILTVPILVYLLGVKPVVATGYSLLVVGSAALAGATRYWHHKLVNIRAALMFAAPAMLTVFATRIYIVPNVPDPVFGIAKDAFIMLLFAVLMIVVAAFMLRPLKIKPAKKPDMKFIRTLKLILGSSGVGLLTGMVGAGGGFLIIPALIALFGLHMKEAIGTSLAVIAINSLIGFNGDIAAGIPLDWHLLGLFFSLTLLGMWIGTTLGKTMEGEKLKKIFGVFTLLIGLAVLAEEAYKIFNI
jgi:uncharacterized protein